MCYQLDGVLKSIDGDQIYVTREIQHNPKIFSVNGTADQFIEGCRSGMVFDFDYKTCTFRSKMVANGEPYVSEECGYRKYKKQVF